MAKTIFDFSKGPVSSSRSTDHRLCMRSREATSAVRRRFFDPKFSLNHSVFALVYLRRRSPACLDNTAFSVAGLIDGLAYSSGVFPFPHRVPLKKVRSLFRSDDRSPPAEVVVGQKAPLHDRHTSRYRSCGHVATFENVDFVPFQGWPGRLRWN